MIITLHKYSKKHFYNSQIIMYDELEIIKGFSLSIMKY